jgi:hypothetical protein
VLPHCVVRGEDHPAYRSELLELCGVGGGGAALRRGECGLQLVLQAIAQDTAPRLARISESTDIGSYLYNDRGLPE